MFFLELFYLVVFFYTAARHLAKALSRFDVELSLRILVLEPACNIPIDFIITSVISASGIVLGFLFHIESFLLTSIPAFVFSNVSLLVRER